MPPTHCPPVVVNGQRRLYPPDLCMCKGVQKCPQIRKLFDTPPPSGPPCPRRGGLGSGTALCNPPPLLRARPLPRRTRVGPLYRPKRPRPALSQSLARSAPVLCSRKYQHPIPSLRLTTPLCLLRLRANDAPCQYTRRHWFHNFGYFGRCSHGGRGRGSPYKKPRLAPPAR